MTAPSQPHSLGALATQLDDTAGTETLGEHVRARLEAPSPGSVVGRYVIRERIGAGGMGEVFAAHDPELDRVIALKLIRDKVRRSEADDVTQRECERLRSEAQALARLSHPNVVHVYEVGQHAVGGRMFLAMELVEGPTLATWRPRSLAELLEVYVQAGRGLAAAHSAGLAHRDFKPGNVLVGGDGRVRVVDFGLATPARQVEEQTSTISHDSDEPRERSGASSLAGPGTLPYMAPEQAFAGTGGAAADQFSFCVALFEAVYGARPFPAATVMQLLAKLESCTIEFPATPPPYGRVPRWLRLLLVRGLSRAPEHRFPSMDELLAVLTRDRSKPWRRVGFAAAVSGVTTLVLLAVLAPSKPFALPDPTLDGVWDGERREQLEAAFDRVEAPWANGSEAAVLSGIDRWSARWIDVARATQHTRDPLARRTADACLASMREQAHATIEALISSEPELLVGAVAAIDALPEPSRCQGGEASGLARIDSELLLPQLRSLADAAAQRGLGNFELARTSADVVLRTATSHGWTALELAALRQRGLAAIDAGDRPAGLADLARARELAVRTGDRATEIELWVDIAWASRKLDDLALRRDRLSLAAAHVDALLAGDPDRHATLLATRVSLALALDLLDPSSGSTGAPLVEAERLLLAGLDRLERIDAGDSGLGIDYLHALAIVRDRAGMLDLAEQDYQTAIARAERVRGTAHPTNARLWHDAGVLAHERGQLEQARDRLGRARELRRAALRIDHPELARSELSLAQLEYVARDYEAAERHARWALATLEGSTGSKDALPEVLRFLGQLEARVSRWETAVDYYERALALMPVANLQRSLAEMELGKALSALGQDARALELLDAALPVIATHQGPERCHQLIRSYERHAESAARSNQTYKAIASLEAARACANDPETKARLELSLERLR
jgi:tRNA A-37 threonylcarbamoyl transferase component Bud32/tetratricopeptide (TPR) repeat protein